MLVTWARLYCGILDVDTDTSFRGIDTARVNRIFIYSCYWLHGYLWTYFLPIYNESNRLLRCWSKNHARFVGPFMTKNKLLWKLEYYLLLGIFSINLSFLKLLLNCNFDRFCLPYNFRCMVHQFNRHPEKCQILSSFLALGAIGIYIVMASNLWFHRTCTEWMLCTLGSFTWVWSIFCPLDCSSDYQFGQCSLTVRKIFFFHKKVKSIVLGLTFILLFQF